MDREQAKTAATADRSSPEQVAILRDNELTPAAANVRRELEERFWVALERLGDDEREIILMRHYEHLGNAEVA